jgi:uncharacterized membrane protein HdeD (DUF308 family)
MPDMKPDIDGKKLFLGITGLLGGVICILVPASTLQDHSLIAFVLMGIPLVMFGAIDIWESIEGLRERKKAKQEIKDTKE